MHHISDYNFFLPDEQIAAQPLEERSASRMLFASRSDKSFDDRHFNELPQFFRSGDTLVINNTKVIPARLFVSTPTGAKVEIFLIEQLDGSSWLALARPAKRLKPDMCVRLNDGNQVRIIEKQDDGKIIIEFETDEDVFSIIENNGKTPLPPYIKRNDNNLDTDKQRYQTVYAKDRGAIAAPTAGLHFTDDVVSALKEKGVNIVEITLHVGYGTFEPVREEDLKHHSVLAERYVLTEAAAYTLNAAKVDGRRIIAVGTTSTRALESNFQKHGRFVAESSLAQMTVLPGYQFVAIDGLLTNFHLPKSSLLVLVSAFGGYDLIMKAYQHAVDSKYRFYSYGDCMLIL